MYSQELAANSKFEHSGVTDQGENLWMGSSDTSLMTIVQDWGAEQAFFISGVFPDVSKTGNWADVGHYTQMVWRNVVMVGCGGTTGSDGILRFVCRYSPPGNFLGETVF